MLFFQKELLNHHVEASFNEFCKFAHDGCALERKDKHQDFRTHFADRRFRHNNAIALSFRKSLSSKADKVSELAQDACTEVLDKNFVDIFASSVQDLA